MSNSALYMMQAQEESRKRGRSADESPPQAKRPRPSAQEPALGIEGLDAQAADEAGDASRACCMLSDTDNAWPCLMLQQAALSTCRGRALDHLHDQRMLMQWESKPVSMCQRITVLACSAGALRQHPPRHTWAALACTATRAQARQQPQAALLILDINLYQSQPVFLNTTKAGHSDSRRVRHLADAGRPAAISPCPGCV